ncbi:MAG: hypothetical protein HY918_03355 [Candidatus Doudnabacteria bacterium]|nr:hypothetical protein [Candidatus Doudnabacteria bacterium]
MTKIFHVPRFRSILAELIVQLINWLIIPISLFYIYFGLLDTNNQTLALLITLILITIVLISLFIPSLLLYLNILKYTISLSDDGRIIEKSLFGNERQVNVGNIDKIEWAYLAEPTIVPNKIITKFGNIYKNTVDRYGLTDLKHSLSFGPRFINSTYSNFPTYAISVDLVKEIQKINPNVVIEENVNKIIQAREWWNRKRRFAGLLISSFLALVGISAQSIIFIALAILIYFMSVVVNKQR